MKARWPNEIVVMWNGVVFQTTSLHDVPLMSSERIYVLKRAPRKRKAPRGGGAGRRK